MRGAGFFREVSYGADDGPSILDHIGRLTGSDKERVLDYLRGGTVIDSLLLVTVDVVDEARPPIGGLSLLSDGEWIWPSDLEHYVELYDCAVPEDFHAHMQRRKWSTTRLTDDEIATINDEIAVEWASDEDANEEENDA